MFAATVLTLFPEMFPGPLGLSLAGRALAEAKWSLDAVNIRDHGLGRHRQVDDTPFGGGAGMVMRPDVLDAAIEAAQPAGRPCSASPHAVSHCAKPWCANGRQALGWCCSAVGTRGWTSG